MKRNINELITVKNFASKSNVTTAYIYKLIKENKIKPVVIDGVNFIDISVLPKLPTAK